MAAKRGTKSAASEAKAEASPAEPELPAAHTLEEPAAEPEDAEVPPEPAAEPEDAEAPPEPANRAERRALAKGKAAPPPTGKVKIYGRGAPATQTPRHWQGRRGG